MMLNSTHTSNTMLSSPNFNANKVNGSINVIDEKAEIDSKEDMAEQERRDYLKRKSPKSRNATTKSPDYSKVQSRVSTTWQFDKAKVQSKKQQSSGETLKKPKNSNN